MSLKPRVVVASPDRVEVAMLSDWLLADGVDPVPVRSLAGALQEVQSRPFDVLVADERFAFEGDLHAVARTRNPRAPLVALGRGPGAGVQRADTFHVPRPIDQTLFLCHVAMAIVEGRPARRSLRKRVTPIDALVEGAAVTLLDVSNEGLRFELARRRIVPPPQFTMRVPLLGVGLTLRRAWIASPHGETPETSWCGAELLQMSPRALQNWRTFVDALPAR
jgi:hypothetical protein